MPNNGRIVCPAGSHKWYRWEPHRKTVYSNRHNDKNRTKHRLRILPEKTRRSETLRDVRTGERADNCRTSVRNTTLQIWWGQRMLAPLLLVSWADSTEASFEGLSLWRGRLLRQRRPRKYPLELLGRGARLVFEPGRALAHVARTLGSRRRKHVHQVKAGEGLRTDQPSTAEREKISGCAARSTSCPGE